MIIVRTYKNEDYPAIETLYKEGTTFGGQFDEARDSREKLDNLSSKKPEAILVAELEGEVVGTVSLFEDGRAAWLYRFAVIEEEKNQVAKSLYKEAVLVFKKWGHSEVLVYAPAGDNHFAERYSELGFTKGLDYTAYFAQL